MLRFSKNFSTDFRESLFLTSTAVTILPHVRTSECSEAELKAIVDDIDKFGLKRRHLNKFIRPASQFENWVLSQEFRTKSAQRYHKRIRKYGKRLFTFLCHDGVPWNNNIAENAIKLVVSRRRLFGASYSMKGMRDYLRFLSFYQTLRRKGGSLLRFLLSKETDLSRFLGE